jgi:aspartyl aminopeptidase
MTEKKENDKIRKELFYKRENGYDLVTVDERVAVEDYCTGYARFLSDARTEREAVRLGIAEAESRGFREYKRGMALKPGSKVYFNNRGKSLILAVMGEKPLTEGCVIAGAHVDAPGWI